MAELLLIAGTDTGVGKTVLTSALLAYGQAYYPDQKIAVFKPIQSGVGDREFYQTHFSLEQRTEEITPLQYSHPLAPPIAAQLEGTSVDLTQVWQTFQNLKAHYDRILIEGVGGLGTPVTYELTVADLARDWRLPTVLVVPVQLGAIGQAVANVALARQSNLDLRGLILSAATPEQLQKVDTLTPPDLLENLTYTPVLGILEPIAPLDTLSAYIKAASALNLERLLKKSSKY